MPAETATFVLPPVLTFDACADLHAFLVQAQGNDLVVDGRLVSRLGGLAAQILATASIAWAAYGVSLTLVNESDPLRRGLETLALWPLPRQQGDF
jgi:chemotaxis protein CheX